MSQGTKIGKYFIQPDYLYYDLHIWADRDSDNEVFIGLTDYGQKDLKDIVNIDLPSPSQRFARAATLISIESISKEYNLKSPFSCIVLEVNEAAITNPELVNTKPFETWLVRVEVIDLSQLDNLKEGDDMIDILAEEVGVIEEANDVNTEEYHEEEDDLYSRLTGGGDEDPYDTFNYSDDFYDEDF